MRSARADDVFLYAAALAFYGLISVAPIVVVTLWVATVVVGRAHVGEVADDLARLAPPALGVDHAFKRAAEFGTTFGLLAVAAALWPASAYGAALVRVLDRVGDDAATTGFRRRWLALLLTATVPALVLGSLVAGYFGAAVLGDSAAEVAIGLVLALGLSFSATVAALVLIYRVLPRTPPGWRETRNGALAAAGAVAILTVGYVAYLRLGANFDRRYASEALTSVVLLAVWLFAVNVALLVGYRNAGRHAAGDD